jgi:hypothetical protein
MPTLHKKTDLLLSEEGLLIQETLRHMEHDTAFNTEACYSADTVNHPDSQISFADKHIKYLRSHPQVNPQHYLSNLRLMTRVRS